MSGFPPPPPPPAPGTRAPRPATIILRQPPPKSAYPIQLAVQGWEYSWEYWFNYFYDELSSETDRRKCWEKICPSDGVYLRDANFSTEEKKQLLLEMMNLGFRPFLTSERLTAAQMFESLEFNRGLMGRKEPGYPLQHSGVRVVFRGDARPYEKIKEKDGTLPQTRVDELAASRSFNQLWHPWNDATLAGKVYFRKGPNQDNCLFTAISVTPNFEVATKFPLLNELRSTNPTAIGTAWVDTYRTGGMKGKVAALKTQFEATKLLCSRANIYVVRIKGGWNTEAVQNDKFPERTFEKLRWRDHFALLKVIRIHYSDDMNAGHLIVVDSLKWLQDPELLTQVLTANSLATLRAHLDNIVWRGKLRTDGIGGIRYAPPGVTPPLEINKVMKFEWKA